MRQAFFDFGQPPVVVFRVREDGRIEAKWPEQDLTTTFKDWPVALEMVMERLNQLVYPDQEVKVVVRCSFS